MDGYNSPQLTELGTVADFTRADSVSFDWDGKLFHRDNKGPGTPSS